MLYLDTILFFHFLLKYTIYLNKNHNTFSPTHQYFLLNVLNLLWFLLSETQGNGSSKKMVVLNWEVEKVNENELWFCDFGGEIRHLKLWHTLNLLDCFCNYCRTHM
jgi:hypothetical protein